jgi:thiamine biosynthesis lipoprotein ApbE
MKFTTIVPTSRNDGTPVAEQEIEAILLALTAQFRGVTLEGTTIGHWTDPVDGKHYRDQGLKLSVVCANEMLAEAEAAVLSIGRRLGQRAMYFEVRDFDGVRFLTVE